MPYISTEALVGGAFLVVLALAYQYLPATGVESNQASGGSKNKKKNKKKSKGGDGQAQAVAPSAGESSSGNKDTATGASSSAQPAQTAGKSTPASQPSQPTPPTQPSQPTKPKTLAEKIAPKARKTKVDDMLAPEDLPAKHARVLRVVDPSAPAPVPELGPAITSPPADPTPSDRKVEEFTDDYAQSEDEKPARKAKADDGWNVVASKPKKTASLSIGGGSQTSSPSAALPVATKLQKKNAKKNEAKKAAKAEEEADRQRRLQAHKRDLERERINEIYATKKKASNGSSGRSTATPTMDTNGKLIWD